MAKILIVDDDQDICEVIELVLQKEGYETAMAHSRGEGRAKVDQFKPDLLILDVMMEQPDDGIALAQELRAAGMEQPILMLTSVAKVTGMHYGRDNEMVPVDAFFEKPVDPDTLIAKVASLLAEEKVHTC
jgi:DNA-binding response OmpR family regulator